MPTDLERLEALARSGDGGAATELLHAARRHNDTALAIRAATLLGATDTLAELAETAWQDAAWPEVAAALAALGLRTSVEAMAALDDAIRRANGRRRTHLLKPRDVLRAMLEMRVGDTTELRYPRANGQQWVERAHERGACFITRSDDGGSIDVVIGTEHVRSYSLPWPPDVLTTQRLERVGPASAAVAAVGERSIEGAIPSDVRVRLERVLHVYPDPSVYPRPFDGMMTELEGLVDAPCYPHVIDLLLRHVQLWQPGERCPRPSANILERPHGVLVGALSWSLERLHRALSRGAPNAVVPLNTLTKLTLTNCVLAEEPREDPAILTRLPALAHLVVSVDSHRTDDLARLARLRFPPTLERVDFTEWRVPGSVAQAVVAHLREDCPKLAVVSTPAAGGERGELEDGLHALAQLPESVGLELVGVHGPKRLAQINDVLGARGVRALLGISENDTDFALLRALSRTRPLIEHVEEIGVKAEPGGLAALLAGNAWTSLRRVEFALTYYGHRVRGQKAARTTLTSADVAALAKSPVIADLTRLELGGTLGETDASALLTALGSQLERLALRGSGIGNAGLAMLVERGVLRDVQHLDLGGARIKGKGAALLADEARGPGSLETLVLSKNSLNKRAVAALARCPALASLRRLDVREVSLSPANKELLLSSPWLAPEAVMLS